MLPGIDGFAVMTEMRHAGQFVPTPMLTARGHPDDVLRGFAAGADDYLTKPFELAILIAPYQRAVAAARMAPAVDESGYPARRRRARRRGRKFTFGDKTMYFDRLELHVRDQVFPLTLMEANVLPVSDPARGQAGIAEGHAGRSMGAARRHRHAGH